MKTLVVGLLFGLGALVANAQKAVDQLQLNGWPNATKQAVKYEVIDYESYADGLVSAYEVRLLDSIYWKQKAKSCWMYRDDYSENKDYFRLHLYLEDSPVLLTNLRKDLGKPTSVDEAKKLFVWKGKRHQLKYARLADQTAKIMLMRADDKGEYDAW